MNADEKKKVVVIGGGVAGTQAARTLRQRGHDVVLFEKSSALGGLLNDINKLPFKEDLLRYTNWLINATMKCGADIRLNTEATVENVMAENPDAVVVASGSSPVRPSLPLLIISYSCPGRRFRTQDCFRKVVVCGGGITAVNRAALLCKM
jgi:NADPH-dependent 2,4-dienoyl-CoA reductase/sulfur reductase-like enzyme